LTPVQPADFSSGMTKFQVRNNLLKISVDLASTNNLNRRLAKLLLI